MTDSSTSRTPVVDVVPASVEPPRQRSRTAYLSGAETGALALVLAAGVLRGWATLSGYFYWDDYLLAGRAARVGVSADLLLFDHDGHFMPGAMLVTWLVTKIAPMSYLLPALLMILAQLAAGAAFYFLLREIFGRRALTLVPLALFLFTPMTLPSSIWWSAAVNLLPMQIAGSLLGLAVVRNARTPSRRLVAGATAAYVLGLLFFEKSVLLLIVAGGLAVLMADPTRPGAVRRAWRRQRALAVSLTLVTAGYLAVYKTYLSSTHLHVPADPSVLTETYHRGLSDTVGPALLGGPLTWTPTGWGSAISTPPSWFVWTSLLALAALVGLTGYLRPRAAPAWLLAAGYVAVDLTLFAVTRLVGPAGAVVIQSTRYTADAALVISLALGFALMAPQGADDVSRRPEVHDWVRAHRPVVSAATALVCGLSLAASTLSTA
ncbi:MAG TPA: hypothetical protein VLW53_02075, partial [Candidatus Eisenbacteria bacterium]|nr:hypothetical protein [Candidatus Eisenbacteria bacterium]